MKKILISLGVVVVVSGLVLGGLSLNKSGGIPLRINGNLNLNSEDVASGEPVFGAQVAPVFFKLVGTGSKALVPTGASYDFAWGSTTASSSAPFRINISGDDANGVASGSWTFGAITVTSCTGCSGAVAGSDTQVIFNDGGAYAGDAQFVWDKTANRLLMTGTASVSAGFEVGTDKLRINSIGQITASDTTASHSFGGTIEGDSDGALSLGTTLKKLKALWSNIVVAVNKLIIPNGTPTIAEVGALGGKTASASSGAFLRVHDGTAERVIKDQYCFTYAYEDPTAVNEWGRKRFNDPFTIDSISVTASASSNAVGWNLAHGPHGAITTTVFAANKSASTSSSPIYTSFTDATLNDNDFLMFKVTSASATVENVDVTVCGRYAP